MAFKTKSNTTTTHLAKKMEILWTSVYYYLPKTQSKKIKVSSELYLGKKIVSVFSDCKVRRCGFSDIIWILFFKIRILKFKRVNLSFSYSFRFNFKWHTIFFLPDPFAKGWKYRNLKPLSSFYFDVRLSAHTKYLSIFYI